MDSPNSPRKNLLACCCNAGITGRDIADRDWSTHPLGESTNWAPSLHTAISMVLNSAFPAYILWGPDFFVFYNDAYIPILGNKVNLGQGLPLRELWSEIADAVCEIAERALIGERTYFEDRLFTLERNGYPEQTYFTFSYSPIQNESMAIVGVLCMIFETTEKVTALARQQESEERLQLSLDASGNIGTWSYDPETNIAIVDDRFARLFQVDSALAQEGTQLERFTNMIHTDDRERVLAAIAHSISSDEPYDIEYRIPQLSGKIIWVNAKGRMFTVDHGKGLRFAGVAVDITDRKQADDELRRLAADLSESNRRKTEFLATLAHELRNPLAPMRTGLELMKIGAADTGVFTQVHAVMERQINQMTHLIDDLMDIARINNGKIELKKEYVSVKSVLLASIEISLSHIEAAGHKLSVNQIPEHFMIDGDRTRLSQVFSNILTNAAKYTPTGGDIEINVAQDETHILISIADNGIGIPTDSIHTVFDMFSQLRRSIDQAHGGLGIGLALARQLVAMHGGTISANSEGDGRGSVFCVRLPLINITANVTAERPDAAVEQKRKHDLRILVTDDNQDAAAMLAELLKALGYHQITIANDGYQALSTAKNFQPDVVFLDIGMPKKNGYEVVKELKNNLLQHMPVAIALTGWGSEQDKELARAAGFDYHLTKPTSLAALLEILNNL